MKTNKIAITGSNGFVGGALYEMLSKNGLDVIKLVRQPSKGEFSFDLSNNAQEYEYLRDIDTIVHCASIIDQNSFSDNEIININSLGTKKLYEHAISNKVSNFINLSSGGVYGNNYLDKISEFDFCKPDNGYSKSKLLAEEYCPINNKIRVMHLRLFFPYGKNQKGRLISNLINDILSGKTIRFNKNGAPLINPIHIEDVLRYIFWCINCNEEGIYNISGNEVYSIFEITKIISDITEKNLNAEFTDNKVCNFIGDNTKIINHSGISPENKLINNLISMIKN